MIPAMAQCAIHRAKAAARCRPVVATAAGPQFNSIPKMETKSKNGDF
jgi:hypothetical protein